MTSTSSSANPSPPALFLRTWVDTLAQVLGEIGGVPLPCTLLSELPAELTPPSEGDLWIVAGVSGGLRGEMALRLPPPSTTGLAQIFMAEPAAPSVEPKSEHREAVVELLRQVAGLVATALRGTSGEIQLRLNAVEGAPSWPASSTAWIRSGTDEAAIAWIEVYLSAALLTSLRADTSEALSKAADPPAGERIPPQGNVNLDLLMDVELAVTLRFGSRRLLLREILELNPGAVVELDRQVNEPVDVLLDGRVVARGDVVVVDGNYGLRVTELAQGA